MKEIDIESSIRVKMENVIAIGILIPWRGDIQDEGIHLSLRARSRRQNGYGRTERTDCRQRVGRKLAVKIARSHVLHNEDTVRYY
ncbi:hypothetical protein EVAR_22161_1 [Eumeta japonica]|uniref:Uncharacterized protein n=1 Tax=Eumeta variegata TaxID=151549 RepID=A0A4C1W2C2_EUMVA|nr:hypothetical protein EVAR_22161_1 [Eumeta japonica]